MRSKAAGLLVPLLCVGLGTGGCASSSGVKHHNVARGVMAALTVLAGAGTVTAAVISDQKETSLRNDVNAGKLSGTQYAARDKEAERWNRIGRASAFATGIFAIGFAAVLEIESAERAQYAPLQPPPPPDMTPGHPEAPAVGPLSLQPTLGVYGPAPRSIAMSATTSAR